MQQDGGEEGLLRGERARVHARSSCSGPAGRPLFVASSATPPSSERASERPAAYKIQIVCPPLRCVPRSFSSVGLGRGRSFRRLSFKQKNHLFRWWVPFVFWNFLAGPTATRGRTRARAGTPNQNPFTWRGWRERDRIGPDVVRAANSSLVLVAIEAADADGRRTGKRRTARNCGIVVEAGNCGQMNAHAGDGGRAERERERGEGAE